MTPAQEPRRTRSYPQTVLQFINLLQQLITIAPKIKSYITMTINSTDNLEEERSWTTEEDAFKILLQKTLQFFNAHFIVDDLTDISRLALLEDMAAHETLFVSEMKNLPPHKSKARPSLERWFTRVVINLGGGYRIAFTNEKDELSAEFVWENMEKKYGRQ